MIVIDFWLVIDDWNIIRYRLENTIDFKAFYLYKINKAIYSIEMIFYWYMDLKNTFIDNNGLTGILEIKLIKNIGNTI